MLGTSSLPVLCRLCVLCGIDSPCVRNDMGCDGCRMRFCGRRLALHFNKDGGASNGVSCMTLTEANKTSFVLIVVSLLIFMGILGINAMSGASLLFLAKLITSMLMGAAAMLYLVKRVREISVHISKQAVEPPKVTTSAEQVGAAIAISLLLWVGVSFLLAVLPFVPVLLLMSFLSIIKVCIFAFLGSEALFGCVYLVSFLLRSEVANA